MKQLFLVLIVVLIAVSGMLIWQGRDLMHPGQQQNATYPVPIERPKPAQPVARARVKAVPPPVVEAPVVAEATPQISTPRELPPFPASTDIAMGTVEDTVTTTYGDPAVSVVALRDGHVVETLFYSRAQERAMTVIRLVDGRVSAAYPKMAPPAPRGLLIKNLPVEN